MSKKVYLHIGMHKTATTWLQKYIFPNLEGDIVYNEENSYKILCDVFRYGLNKEDIATAKKHFRSLEGRHLFSAEIMCGDLFDGYSNFEEQMDVLKSIFSEWEVQIIFVSRLPSSWLLSTYRESIFEHHYQSLNAFLEGHRWLSNGGDQFRLEKMIDGLRHRFGESVLLLEFEHFKNNQKAFVDRIAGYLGVSCGFRTEFKAVNVGYSNNTIIFALWAVAALKRTGFGWFVPRPIFFFGNKSIYKMERIRFSYRFGFLFRKFSFPIRRGNWLRFVLRGLDWYVLARQKQVDFVHNFRSELERIDSCYVEILREK